MTAATSRPHLTASPLTRGGRRRQQVARLERPLAVKEEVLTNERYRDAGGTGTELWVVPGAGHTGGLRTRPAEYERRTTTFLDRALGL